MTDETLFKIAITKVPMVGPVIAKHLISYCGGVEAVFNEKRKALLKIPGVGNKTIDILLKQDPEKLAEQELRFIEQHNIQPLFYLDETYPFRLKNYPDCPLMLYYKGNADLNHPRIVSVVGTRKPTLQGQAICEDLISDLKEYGVLILSGLAYGIDVTAHKKCLNLEIPTVGVLGHGLSQIYPSAHRNVAQKMIQAGGLLTEFTSELGPEREHFPMRNRIVAGMCDALIVVETKAKGGSMITADIANNYNKDVFAIPGRIGDPLSKGCIQLIKSHKAALIESAKDIGYIMRWEKIKAQKIVQKKLFLELSESEHKVIGLIRKHDNLSIDQLNLEMKMTPSKMASLLLHLEFKGLVKSLPGKRYILEHS